VFAIVRSHAEWAKAAAVVTVAAALVTGGLLLDWPGRAVSQGSLPARAYLAEVARDGAATGAGDPTLPQPDPTYCRFDPGPLVGPPKSVLGLLTLRGAPLAAGTVVQLVFDNKLGPAARTRETGGYRLDYDIGSANCANHTGALIGVLVNGQTFMSTVRVGDVGTDPFFQFNVNVQ
jgi:hypothetical protein